METGWAMGSIWGRCPLLAEEAVISAAVDCQPNHVDGLLNRLRSFEFLAVDVLWSLVADYVGLSAVRFTLLCGGTHARRELDHGRIVQALWPAANSLTPFVARHPLALSARSWTVRIHPRGGGKMTEIQVGVSLERMSLNACPADHPQTTPLFSCITGPRGHWWGLVVAVIDDSRHDDEWESFRFGMVNDQWVTSYVRGLKFLDVHFSADLATDTLTYSLKYDQQRDYLQPISVHVPLLFRRHPFVSLSSGWSATILP